MVAYNPFKVQRELEHINDYQSNETLRTRRKHTFMYKFKVQFGITNTVQTLYNNVIFFFGMNMLLVFQLMDEAIKPCHPLKFLQFLLGDS